MQALILKLDPRRITVLVPAASALMPCMRGIIEEFAEIAHTGDTVTFKHRTTEDGRRTFQVG